MIDSGIAIVTLPPERWEEYRDLRLEALLTAPSAFGETYDRAVQRTPEEWRARLVDPTVLLRFAEADGRLVGLAGAIQVDGEPGVALVISVDVTASARGRGVARRLVGRLIDGVAERWEAVVVRLFVNDTNAPAITVYRSLGFAEVGVERDAIHHNGRSYDELIMERPVGPAASRTGSPA